MADTKVSSLAVLPGASVAAGDVVLMVDVSDTSMASTGTTKRSTVADLSTALFSIGAAPVVVADGATVTVDASLGRTFRVTLAGNRTLSITNPTDGKVIDLEITQDATGSRTLALPTGAGGVSFSTAAPSSLYVLSTAAAAVDVLTLKYNATAARWWAVGFLKGF